MLLPLGTVAQQVSLWFISIEWCEYWLQDVIQLIAMLKLDEYPRNVSHSVF
jgi:hypothetical protein